MKKASRQKIAWFRKKLGPLIEERTRAGYTACVILLGSWEAPVTSTRQCYRTLFGIYLYMIIIVVDSPGLNICMLPTTHETTQQVCHGQPHLERLPLARNG